MPRFSMSQIQALLEEQDAIADLTLTLAQLVEQQVEHRRHLKLARELHETLRRLHARVELARSALTRHASLAEDDDDDAKVEMNAPFTSRPSDGDEEADTEEQEEDIRSDQAGKKMRRPRTSTDALCATALAMVDRLHAQHNDDDNNDNNNTEADAHRHTTETESASTQPPGTLLYAPHIAALINENRIAELALEEATTRVRRGRINPETRLYNSYTPLRTFLTSPRSAQRNTEALKDLQDRATTIAAALVGLLIPLLNALNALAQALSAEPDKASLFVPSVTPNTPLDRSECDSFTGNVEASSLMSFSAVRPTTTFLEAGSSGDGDDGGSDAPITPWQQKESAWPREAPTSQEPRSIRALQKQHPQPQQTSYSAAHNQRRCGDTVISTGTVAYAEEMCLPSRGAENDELARRWWASALFWCRALAHLLLDRVVDGILMCHNVDIAIQKPQHQQHNRYQTTFEQFAHHDASADDWGGRGSHRRFEVSGKAASEFVDVHSMHANAVPLRAEDGSPPAVFSSVRAACARADCGFDVDQFRSLIACLFGCVMENRDDGDHVYVSHTEDGVVMPWITSALDGTVPTDFSLAGLDLHAGGAEAEVAVASSDISIHPHVFSTTCAMPTALTAAHIQKSVRQLALCVAP